MTISLNQNFDSKITFWALSSHRGVGRKKFSRFFTNPTTGKKLANVGAKSEEKHKPKPKPKSKPKPKLKNKPKPNSKPKSKPMLKPDPKLKPKIFYYPYHG
jgi:hypothetical protein